MATQTSSVTLDEAILADLDRLVQIRAYPDRGHAIEDALREGLLLLRRSSLAAECEGLDPEEEQALAEERLQGEGAWPEY